ncbi:MAG TPA: helicase-associated domain-containing protein [Bacillota bacterium]
MRGFRPPRPLRSILAECDPRTLQRLSSRYRVPVARPESRWLDALAERLAQPQSLLPELQTLKRGAVELLFALTWGWEGEAPPRQLGLSREASAQRQRDLDELAEAGLVFQIRRYGPHGDVSLVVPDETLAGLTMTVPFLLNTRLNPEERFLVASSAPVGAAAPALGPRVLGDLVRLLGELWARPVRITQQGMIYKRDIQRLEGVLDPETLERLSPAWENALRVRVRNVWEDGVPPSLPWAGYPRRLGRLLAAAAGLELLETRGNELHPIADWMSHLDELEPATLWRDLVFSLLDIHVGAMPELFSFLQFLCSGHWFVPDRWWRLCHAVKGLRHAPLLLVMGDEALRTLAICGVLEAATVEGEAAVRLTAEGQALLTSPDGSDTVQVPVETTFIAQASGELLAPPFLHPAVLARLELLTERERVDRVTSYRLSPWRIKRALDDGWSKQAIVDFFVEGSGGRLPQPLRFQLDEWMAGYGRARLMEVLLLACESAELADQLMAHPAVRKAIAGRLSPTHLIVRTDKLAAMLPALAEAGCPVPSRVDRPGGPVVEIVKVDGARRHGRRAVRRAATDHDDDVYDSYGFRVSSLALLRHVERLIDTAWENNLSAAALASLAEPASGSE